ncbi:Protein TOC75-3 [Forsythia ovata]|uniref:Protein TOC75-3 n=1 Tax=Forsythia ovata TaxID=205694 RepID=A0ABD1PX99_9LAMI
MDPDMTDKNILDCYESQDKDYKMRIEQARSCLLPLPVQREILQILREQGKVVSFRNLNTNEVVCEVVKGDITQLVIQFHDKLGNVCEGNTQDRWFCDLLL